MSKNQKTAVESLETVIKLHKRMNNHINNILQSEDDVSFSKDIKALRIKLENEDNKENVLSKPTQDIFRILNSYNEDFSQVVLAFVKQKVSEYRNLNILDNYKFTV